MGLDMYLEGKEYLYQDWKNPENNPTRDGFKLKGYRLELGYWRKHPNLHGYIIEQFADGVDECQEIELSEGNLEQILKATQAKKLPKTEGFFFGESTPDDDKPTIEIIKKALAWLRAGKDRQEVSRSVVYLASW